MSTKKIRVLDLCVANEKACLSELTQKELFEYEFGNWRGYITKINQGNLDGMWFIVDDLDKGVFILDDGGELFRLKDGRYYNVCWRGNCCRVWEEDDKERTNWFDKLLK